MNVDVSINSGLNVEAVFSGNDIAVEVAFAEPLKVDVEILAGTKGIKGDSMFQQVGTEIIPIDGNATLDASFIANLPEIDNEVTELSTNPVKSSGIWRAIEAVMDWAVGFFDMIFAWINNETAGTITRDTSGNIVSVTTFDETTTFNRNAQNEITGWETPNATYQFTYDAEGGITGWTFTKK